jgi:hypothetical protein
VCTPCISCGVCCSLVHLRSLFQLVLVVGLVWLFIYIYVMRLSKTTPKNTQRLARAVFRGSSAHGPNTRARAFAHSNPPCGWVLTGWVGLWWVGRHTCGWLGTPTKVALASATPRPKPGPSSHNPAPSRAEVLGPHGSALIKQFATIRNPHVTTSNHGGSQHPKRLSNPA